MEKKMEYIFLFVLFFAIRDRCAANLLDFAKKGVDRQVLALGIH